MQVLTALRADHWLYAHGNQQSPLKHGINQGIRDAFYVDEPWWKAAVYGRVVDMTLRAGRGLHAMATAQAKINSSDYAFEEQNEPVRLLARARTSALILGRGPL